MQLVLELHVGCVLPQGLKRGPGDSQANPAVMVLARDIPLLLYQCLLVPLCRKVPSNELPCNIDASNNIDNFMAIALTVL